MLSDTTACHLPAAAQHWQSPASRDLHRYEHILLALLSGAVAPAKQKSINLQGDVEILFF